MKPELPPKKKKEGVVEKWGECLRKSSETRHAPSLPSDLASRSPPLTWHLSNTTVLIPTETANTGNILAEAAPCCSYCTPCRLHGDKRTAPVMNCIRERGNQVVHGYSLRSSSSKTLQLSSHTQLFEASLNIPSFNYKLFHASLFSPCCTVTHG